MNRHSSALHTGWLRPQMSYALEPSFVGCLDELLPLEHFVFDPSRPFDALVLKGSMIYMRGNPHTVKLIALGKSILWRVMFQIGGQ